VSETVAPPAHRSRTARDMAISLIVLLIPVAILVALFRLRGGEDVVVVDPSAALGEARAAAVFPVAEPHGLDGGWRALSAQYADATLRIGYLTPHGGGVQLIEAKQVSEGLLGAGAQAVGSTTINGEVWRTYSVAGGERAFVLVQADRSLIVIGRADEADLTALAQAVG
jgi:hypothetical protein